MPHSQSQPLDPDEVRRWLAVITKDPERCRQFLLEAGFIDEHGDLTPQYRSDYTGTSNTP